MAATAITPAGQKVVIITQQQTEGLYIALYAADDQFRPIGEPEELGDPGRNEEDFHRGLRKEAGEKGHFVKEFSTHPEWNEGYIEPKIEEI